MPSGVGSKYHVALATLGNTGVLNSSFLGYMLRGRGYSKTDAKIFAPRFGTGEQGLGDLDLYKTWTQNDFSGGSFQEYMLDATRTSLTDFAIRNPVDNLLYPVKAGIPVSGGAPTGTGYRSAGVVYKGLLYFAINGNTLGGVSKYDTSTALVTSVKADFATKVSSLEVLGNKLWVATSGGLTWAYDGTTWTSDSRYGFTLWKAFNGKLYANGSPGGVDAGKLWSRDTTPGVTGVALQIGEVGDVNVPITKMLVFNHRLYMAKTDGLFVFDGVTISTILGTDVVPGGISDMAVQNGSLYFVSAGRIYRYNGASVELVQDFGGYEQIQTLDAAYGRLWVGTLQTVNAYGKTGLVVNVYSRNVYMYDGSGFIRYRAMFFDHTSYPNYDPELFWTFVNGYIIEAVQLVAAAGSSQVLIYEWLASAEYFGWGSGAPVVITTSQFDASFPTMDKMAAAFKLQVENMDSSDSIDVAMRTFDGTVWSAYINIGQITSTVNSLNIVKALQGTAGSLSFKRVQFQITYTFRISGTAGAIKAFAFEYVLAPVLRREWTLSVLAQGQSDAPMTLDDGSEEMTKANALRDFIYHCRANVPPLLFQDIDTTTLTGAVNNAVTTIPVASTNTFGFEAGDLMTIDDEVIQIGASTPTSFTGCVRGVYGTTAASHLNAAVVNSTYRVVLTKIQNESVIIPAIVDGVMNTYGNESELTIALSEAK